MTDRPRSETTARVSVFDGTNLIVRKDHLATEEPLEIRIVLAHESRTVAVTMRTPGSDFELASGFLFSEGVVQRGEQIVRITYCRDEDLPLEQLYNIVIVELDPSLRPDLTPLQRHFQTSSACGVCGKANLEAISLRGIEKMGDGPRVTPEVVAALPDRLREAQRVFKSTGGLHAAALFTEEGELVATREDVGRHNAVDKLVGWALLNGRMPLDRYILMVSGRSSFEIAQKAAVARTPIVCSVSAPSSLAVDVANEFGMTLVGFLRDGRFNVYAGVERIAVPVEG
ncbi:MAG: FdhD protein [Actinomycetota bacterium]|nr:FdhD protein [Actinomycetota bacterium]